MNIIIGQDKHVRLTQYSNQATYNLTDIVFYISKMLQYNNILIQVKNGSVNYFFQLKELISNTHEFYTIYQIIFPNDTILPSGIYSINFQLDADNVFAGKIALNSIIPMNKVKTSMSNNVTLPYGLIDNHDPIDIVNKAIQINNNQNIIIAGDNISQVMRFRVARYQDNIDLLSKEIYIDYRPLGHTKIISDLITKDIIATEIIDGIDYCIIPWVITTSLTLTAGEIPFAISATDPYLTPTQKIDEQNETDQIQRYVWQTLPAVLFIQSGLGKNFNQEPIFPEEDNNYDILAQEVISLSNKMNNLDYIKTITDNGTFTLIDQENGSSKETDITLKQMLTNVSEDEKIIFSGGGAFE